VQIDGGMDKAIIIPLLSSEKHKIFNSPIKTEFADFEKPTRVLKFIVNKFQKTLKMRITCLNKQGVFDLIEHSEYYSTLYHNRRVCKDDKYLLNVEENVYNIVS